MEIMGSATVSFIVFNYKGLRFSFTVSFTAIYYKGLNDSFIAIFSKSLKL